MRISTFYQTIKTLLLTHTKNQIFLRNAKSLGHAYKEVEVIAQEDIKKHSLESQTTIDSLSNNSLSHHHTLDSLSNNTITNKESLHTTDSKSNQDSITTDSLNKHSLANQAHLENQLQQAKETIEVKVNFFGLFGSHSPLPNYMLDKFARNEDSGNGFSLFFDFLNNHILWLFYESISLRNYHRSFNENLDDKISLIFLKILGFNNTTNAREYLPFSPLMLSMRRPKPYIEKVLQHNFNLKNRISIIENIPQQIPIDITQQNVLGTKNTILGKNFLLGTTICSHQNKILLDIKDLQYYEALAYFPSQTQFNRLKESIAFLTNNEFAIDLCLHIKYSPQMNFILGKQTNAKLGFGLLLGGNKKLKNIDYCKHITLHQ